MFIIKSQTHFFHLFFFLALISYINIYFKFFFCGLFFCVADNTHKKTLNVDQGGNELITREV